MERHDVDQIRETFAILSETTRSQAGVIRLPPDEATGGPENRHSGSDQWIFVRAGSGTAIVEGEQEPITAGDLLLIPAGAAHELVAGPETPLEMVTVYAPPAY